MILSPAQPIEIDADAIARPVNILLIV